MQLEERIIFLEGLLEKYGVDYLNQQFKEKEVAYAKDLLSRAKYSEQMQKKILSEAKRKSISKGRRVYIQDLIDRSRNFDSKDYQKELSESLKEFFIDNSQVLLELDSIDHILFEHDYSPKQLTANIFTRNEKELTVLKTTLNFQSIWGFIEERKFINMAEALEFIEVEEEEYPLIFEELFKLRSYKIVKDLLQTPSLKKILSDLIPLKIHIGEHDNWTYQIL